MRHVFIVNPVSGKADASGTLVPQIIAAAKELNIEYQIILTEHPRHACELAQTAAQSGEEVRLYSCGGDGTLNEVLAGAYLYPNAQVACVPCGSGNDFVRNFGGKEPFLNLKELILGQSIPIDLIKTQTGIAAAICSAGLDAEVAYGIPKFRRMPFMGGSMAYNLSIVQCLCGPLGHKLRIIADGEEILGDYLMVALCNGIAYGGGFVAAPGASLNDGLLDLLLVKKIGRMQVAGVVGLYKSGKHLQNGKVAPQVSHIIDYRKVRQLTLQTLNGKPIIVNQDGECTPQAELSAGVLPRAARFVLPQGLHTSLYCPIAAGANV